MTNPSDSAAEAAQKFERLADGLATFAGVMALVGWSRSPSPFGGVRGQKRWFAKRPPEPGAERTWSVRSDSQEHLATAWRTVQELLITEGQRLHLVITEDDAQLPPEQAYLIARNPMRPDWPGIRALVQRATEQEPERIMRIDTVEGAAFTSES